MFLFLQGSAANASAQFLLIGGMLFIFYFFFIRPQMKKAREQQGFIEELKKGDRVVTIGGLHGRIAKISEQTILLDVGNNVKLKVDKSVISMDFTNALTSNND